MGWISLNKAAKITGIDRKNLRGKLSNLEKKHPVIYKKLVRKSGSYYELKEPEIIIFFQTDFRKLNIKPFLENLVSKSNDLITLDSLIISKAQELQSRSENNNLEIDIDEIIEQTTDPLAINRLAVSINICYDYSMGFESMEECANKYQLNRNKFYRWCYKFPQLQSLYDLAHQIRKQYSNKRSIEESEENIEKIARGSKTTTEVIDCEVISDDKGKQILKPTKYRISTKSHPPDREANMLILINKDPQNWKRVIPPEQILLSNGKAPKNQFAGMTPEQVREWLKENDPNYGKYFGT